MKPVSTGSERPVPGSFTETVLEWPPAYAFCSKTVTSKSRCRKCAHPRPDIPVPTIARRVIGYWRPGDCLGLVLCKGPYQGLAYPNYVSGAVGDARAPRPGATVPFDP